MNKTNVNRQAAVMLAVIMLATATLSAPARALQPHIRDGWLVGLSYGYSEGDIDWGPEIGTTGSYGGGATPQIRVGRMVGSKLALGLDYNGWMLEDGEVPVKLRSSLQNLSLAATWYPGDPTSGLGGFYVRGGAGLAWASLTFVEIDEIPPDHVPLYQEHGTRIDETGLALHVQLGYEFRFSRSFAAGLGLGFNHLSIGREIHDSATYFPATLTGLWYW